MGRTRQRANEPSEHLRRCVFSEGGLNVAGENDVAGLVHKEIQEELDLRKRDPNGQLFISCRERTAPHLLGQFFVGTQMKSCPFGWPGQCFECIAWDASTTSPLTLESFRMVGHWLLDWTSWKTLRHVRSIGVGSFGSGWWSLWRQVQDTHGSVEEEGEWPGPWGSSRGSQSALHCEPSLCASNGQILWDKDKHLHSHRADCGQAAL